MKRGAFKDYLGLTIGTLLIAAGVYFFKFPNHFTTGGVTGLAIILAHYIPGLSQSGVTLILNNVLLVVGLLILGRSFGLRTAYCSLLLSALLWLFEALIPLKGPLTNQPLVELMFAVLIPAFGSAILFNLGGSSGGTDIVAMIMSKHTSIKDLGQALLISDVLIAIACFFPFGVETGLFSLLGLGIRTMMLDSVLESFNSRKYFNIITTLPKEICHFITADLGRSATLFEGQGAYSGDPRTLLLVAVNPRQALRLRGFVKQTDPNAFMAITTTSEIIGKGFRTEV